MKKQDSLAVVLILAAALSGCNREPHQRFNGPKAILVFPKLEGAPGGFFTCKGGELWREGNNYAVRFETRYDGRSQTIELHGLNQVLIQDDHIVNLTCE
jgi:hypothetical protein